MALSQPQEISLDQRRRLENFFTTELSYLLPCPICGSNLRDHLKTMPPLSAALAAGRDDFFGWTVELHNRVNRAIKKPTLSTEEALHAYAAAFAASRSVLLPPPTPPGASGAASAAAASLLQRSRALGCDFHHS